MNSMTGFQQGGLGCVVPEARNPSTMSMENYSFMIHRMTILNIIISHPMNRMMVKEKGLVDFTGFQQGGLGGVLRKTQKPCNNGNGNTILSRFIG